MVLALESYHLYYNCFQYNYKSIEHLLFSPYVLNGFWQNKIKCDYAISVVLTCAKRFLKTKTIQYTFPFTIV